jgi:hypothetical protein
MVVGSIQIYSIGPQDFYLTGNPQITFFKSVFRRHTRFSSKTERIFFDSQDPSLGSSNANAKIKKDGDLLGDIFVRADITATCSGDNRYTVNNFGNSLIKKVEFLIGKNVIDIQRAPWFQIYDELNTQNYEDLVETGTSATGGKSTTITGTDKFTTRQRVKGDQPLFFSGSGTYTKRLYIPLNFWFNKNPGMYLPLISLYRHEVELNFDLEETSVLIGDNTNITNMSVNFQLYGNFITLDEDEKRKFSQSNHEYIIEQVQMNDGEKGIETTSSEETNGTELAEISYDLKFLHPVKYMAWVIVNKGTNGSNSGQGPSYFCSLTNNSNTGNDASLGSGDLYIGGIEREINLKMSYFTRYQPMKYCNNIPSLDRIGFYSFAINPLSNEPSGTCNFSKIKDNFIRFKFSNNTLANIKEKTLHIFAVSYNILVITDGMGMLRYN